MSASGIAAVLSLAVVSSTIVFITTASHEERLPDAYFSVDKTKPWNELARSLDPRMSDGEFDEMRSRYFYEVVAPKLSSKSETFAAYQYFMQQTDRPWQWNRRPSRGYPPTSVLLVSSVSAAYLAVVLPIWAWRRVLKPVGLMARDDGLAGVAQVILHGRKSTMSNASRRTPGSKESVMASGTFQLARFDEGGPEGRPEKRRLVCVIESGGKLAIWGQEAPSRNMRNIDSVLKAGMPCTVECEYQEPADWAKGYGHTHWVAQDYALRVIPE